MDCRESILSYFYYQGLIKKQLSNIHDECPDLVAKYLLQLESKHRVEKLMKCNYGDTIDKKLYIEYEKMKSCEKFKTIF